MFEDFTNRLAARTLTKAASLALDVLEETISELRQEIKNGAVEKMMKVTKQHKVEEKSEKSDTTTSQYTLPSDQTEAAKVLDEARKHVNAGTRSAINLGE